jgi:carbon-monoxide dehydrogenase medium subunit
LRASDTQVLMPSSVAQAVEQFGDGRGVTVFAGGTILMPLLAYGRYPRGGRTLMLEHAGLDELADDGTVRVGAMTRLSALAASGIEPLASAALDIADLEVRAQATIGGNVCGPPGVGDLQVPLIAVGARVRSAAAGGERTETIEEFLGRPEDQPRLVLGFEFERPRRSAYISQRRRHGHSYPVLSVACAETADGVRVAAGGVGPHAVRLLAVERALADGEPPAAAAARALAEAQPHDDALASAWYRRAVLPTILTRALEPIRGG